MVRPSTLVPAAILTLAIALSAAAAHAQCQTASFEDWRDSVKQEAIASGISAQTAAALDRAVYDKSVIGRDRSQGVFNQTFLEFSDRMVSKYRLQQGAMLLKKHGSTFGQVEEKYGVPGPVIAAFWGLETDFGANLGDFPTLTALATLAYDCRRPDVFHEQLLAALKVIDRGDLSPDEMKGAWAGELGQTQFLPKDYAESAVDFDHDGKRDLLHSVPDVLASSANLLVKHGWRAGEPWLQEVRVPASLPWEQADLAITLPRSQWVAYGVTSANDTPLAADDVKASLLLPMGRSGPAFLAYRNFNVFTEWNKSLVYTTTAAYLATRLAGAPPISRGQPVEGALAPMQISDLQELLIARGYDVGGKADGILGAATRSAVRDMQLKFGMPADSYPTADLMARLRQ